MTSQHSGLAPTSALKAFLAARDFLLKHREEYETARREFRWPELSEFNWALDYFDHYAHGNSKSALWIVNDDATEVKLSLRRCRAAPTRSRISCAAMG
jgi:acetyl-CoA synthetase